MATRLLPGNTDPDSSKERHRFGSATAHTPKPDATSSQNAHLLTDWMLQNRDAYAANPPSANASIRQGMLTNAVIGDPPENTIQTLRRVAISTALHHTPTKGSVQPSSYKRQLAKTDRTVPPHRVTKSGSAIRYLASPHVSPTKC